VQSFIKKAMRLVRAVVKRRTRRGVWAYLLWLLAYLPPMVWIAGGLSFQVRPYQMLPLLIPLVVVLVQVVYPTWLGWAVIVIPSVCFAGVGVCAVVLTAPARVQRHELAALAISSVAVSVYVLVCVALGFARPKLVDAVIAEPVARPKDEERGHVAVP
jgi:hypothetical protein